MLFCCRSIDFNPNKQYQLATAGDDGSVRFWDIRQASKGPVAARTGDHSHWIWSVRYNAFHDQLILTSSSDGRFIKPPNGNITCCHLTNFHFFQATWY